MIINGNTAYYSHSIKTYDTIDEKEEYRFLRKCFSGKIICPNRHANIFKKDSDYIEIVESIDVLFISEYNGYIGKGSFKDCETALNSGIPVYLIERDGSTFTFRSVVDLVDVYKYNPLEYGYLSTVSID